MFVPCGGISLIKMLLKSISSCGAACPIPFKPLYCPRMNEIPLFSVVSLQNEHRIYAATTFYTTMSLTHCYTDVH